MNNRYIRTQHGTNGKSKLISFEIPGVWLVLLEEPGRPTEAFGVKGHGLDSIVTGAKKGIEIEMQRLTRCIDREKRHQELEAALEYIDEVLCRGNVLRRGRVVVFE